MMSVSYHSLTVIFKDEIREEKVEHIVNAIKMIKGVMDVVPEVANRDLFIAKKTAKFELLQKIYELLGYEG